MSMNPLAPMDGADLLRQLIESIAGPPQEVPQAPLVTPEQLLPQGFQQPGGNFLDRLAMGLSQGIPQAPRGFGGSFLSGAARGFTGVRGADVARRQEALKGARADAAAQNKANLDATLRAEENNRKAMADARMELVKAQLRRAGETPAAMTPDERIDYERRLYRARAEGTRAGNPSTSKATPDIFSGKLPTAGERVQLSEDAAVIKQTENIESLYKPEFVGPQNMMLGKVKDTTGRGLKKGEGDFRAAIAAYRNKVINQISGAAVSAQEAVRLREQIPDATDPPEMFVAKLRQTKKNLIRLAQQRRDVMTQTGVDLSRLDPLPSGAQPDQWDEFFKSIGAVEVPGGSR